MEKLQADAIAQAILQPDQKAREELRRKRNAVVGWAAGAWRGRQHAA